MRKSTVTSLLVISVLFPFLTHAETLLSNSDNSGYFITNSVNSGQFSGVGGQIDTISFDLWLASPGFSPPPRFTVGFQDVTTGVLRYCLDTDYPSQSFLDYEFSIPTATTTVEIFCSGWAEYPILIGESAILDPSHTYSFTIAGNYSEQIGFIGSSTVPLPWYIVDGENSGAVNLYNLQPATGSSTPLTTTISFNFSASPDSGVAEYIFRINGINNNRSYTFTGTTSPSQGTVSRQVALQEGLYEIVGELQRGSDAFPAGSWWSVTNNFVVSSSSASYLSVFYEKFPDLQVATSSSDLFRLLDIKSYLARKIPFAYIIDIVGIWNQYASASSTGSAKYSIDIDQSTYATTSPIGHFIPDFDIISSTTIMRYFPPGAYDALMALQVAALWLMFVGLVWTEGRRFMHTL